MNLNFFQTRCQDYSIQKLFGLCDDQLRERAYLDENDGSKWIAVVVNEYLYEVTFIAVDHCIEIKRENGTMDKRCDGLMIYNSCITFVELKERERKPILLIKNILFSNKVKQDVWISFWRTLVIF